MNNIISSYQKFYKQFCKLSAKNHLDTIRIYLTESCNANCSHCFNKDFREEGHMNFDLAKKMFSYLSNSGVRKLKIMGGEPTVHPQFTELYNFAQTKFEVVGLFTNALNDKIYEINPRPLDSIVYNFLFVNSKFDFDKLLPEHGNLFPRAFEIVIDCNTNIEILKERINYTHLECRKRGINKLFYQLTINCISNIFEQKERYNSNFREMLKFLVKSYPYYISFDHTVPYCFWEDETKDLMEENKIYYYKSTCRGTDYGLIDSKFNLLHCNQHPIVITSLLDGKKFLAYNKVEKLLQQSNEEKKKKNFLKMCSKCDFFEVLCTGGCMIHKDFVIN